MEIPLIQHNLTKTIIYSVTSNRIIIYYIDKCIIST